MNTKHVVYVTILLALGLATPALAQKARAAIVDISLGDTADQATAKLRAADPQMLVTPHVLDQGGRGLPDIPYSIRADVPSRGNKPGQSFVVLLSAPGKEPQRVIAIFRNWNAAALKPIAWSQMVAALDAKYGPHMTVAPQRTADTEHEQWFFGVNGQPIAPPAGAAGCSWQGGFLRGFQDMMSNGGAQANVTDRWILGFTHIDQRCGRVYQSHGFGGGGNDLRISFQVTLIDTPAFYRALRTYTALMVGMQNSATRAEEQEARQRGLPQQ